MRMSGGAARVGNASEFVLGLNPVIRRDRERIDPAAKPLVSYLTTALNVPVRIVVEHDYRALIQQMAAGEIDAALLGEYAFYIAQLEAGAEALAVSVETGSDEPATYQSVVIAWADAPIHTLADLRGETVGFVDPGSTAGYLIPRRMLREAGLDPDADVTARFFAAHRAVAEGVLAGAVPAGALHSAEYGRVTAENAEAAARLRTIAMSPPIPKGPFAVRRGLDREIRQRLLQALLVIHDAAPAAARHVLSGGTRWRPTSNRHVTLKTIAALSGVSYGTVSRVINGRAHVAPETQARVMGIVKDIGYRPNAAAVSLIANRSDLIGFLVPDAADPSVARYLAGMQRAFGEMEMRVVLCPVEHDRTQEAELLGLLDDGRFGGLVLTAWSRETAAVSTLAAAGRALVILGVSAGSAPIAAVAPDDDATVAVAVAHLQSLGHEAIGAIVAPSLRRVTERRLGLANIAAIRDLSDERMEVVRDRARDLLGAEPRPTAIICGTDRHALGVLHVAAERGIRVPDDLSIIALTDTWLASALTPALTTVDTMPEALGERAAQVLIEQMSGGDRLFERVPLPAPVVIARASTVPWPRRA